MKHLLIFLLLVVAWQLNAQTSTQISNKAVASPTQLDFENDAPEIVSPEVHVTIEKSSLNTSFLPKNATSNTQNTNPMIGSPKVAMACDTLRNYNPGDPTNVINAGSAYINGTGTLFSETVVGWAEQHTAPASTQVKALRVVPGTIAGLPTPATGTVTFYVYAGGATPGGSTCQSNRKCCDFTNSTHSIQLNSRRHLR